MMRSLLADDQPAVPLGHSWPAPPRAVWPRYRIAPPHRVEQAAWRFLERNSGRTPALLSGW